MDQTLAVRVDELDAQTLELLPTRETLFFDVNIANIVGVNISMAINAASIGASATALAGQGIFVNQH